MDRRTFLGALCAAPVALIAPAAATERTKIADVSWELFSPMRDALDHEAALREAFESCPETDVYEMVTLTFNHDAFRFTGFSLGI